MAKLKIKFTDNAFNEEVERSQLHDCKQYTRHVAEMNKAAESIDRYDDFASLTLKPSAYAMPEDSVYGIKAEKFHRGKDRLLPHQIDAAKGFLKELRGFGLLADVVGSGKTYEACAVLSELSAKGKISSALIVVPDQVYSTWKEVLEMRFGLGANVLKTLTRFDESLFEVNEVGMLIPNAPILVKTEDFVRWREHDVKDLLFDVVVVDEAHNLCGEEGESAKALKLLSILMETKKKAGKTYCLLLSATPHSGDLANMFRLWYFIRCKGGQPSDFDEKDDVERTEKYVKEKLYYKEHICRGATTVMEFINKVKLLEVAERKEFKSFLLEEGVIDFDSLLEGEKKKIVDKFLNDNKAIEEIVIKNIANAYHNGVLRSIMIRQPNDGIRKGKRIENVLFFPAVNKAKTFIVQGLDGKDIVLSATNMYGKTAITTLDEEGYSLEEYVRAYKGNLSINDAYAELFFNNRGNSARILKSFGLTDEAFAKSNSLRFYHEQFKNISISEDMGSDNNVGMRFMPVYSNETVFDAKFKELSAILDKHSKERIIIFFDYDVEKSAKCDSKVIELLKENKKYAKRVLIGDKFNKERTEAKFNEKEDTILVVVDNGFTEGANLQKSSVIVNFQVTPNPLAMEQRIGRIFRLGQENDVIVYSLADMMDLEGYVLTYFTSIGLMTSNSGDAAIIAGSNNDNMVTIRCPACGNVKLMSKEDFEAYKKNDNDEIYCVNGGDKKCCQNSARGTRMVEINSNEMKCNHCGSVVKRQSQSEGGQYYCVSINGMGSGLLCSSGDPGDRKYYCSKICAISHCEKFISGALKGKCKALKAYTENRNITDRALLKYCDECSSKTICGKCRLDFNMNSISSCSTCSEAKCSPKPHVLEFNNEWEAECPVCKQNEQEGVLKPVTTRTFETYIRQSFSYEQDGGKSFCTNLEKEVRKVKLIQKILSKDEVRK